MFNQNMHIFSYRRAFIKINDMLTLKNRITRLPPLQTSILWYFMLESWWNWWVGYVFSQNHDYPRRKYVVVGIYALIFLRTRAELQYTRIMTCKCRIRYSFFDIIWWFEVEHRTFLHVSNPKMYLFAPSTPTFKKIGAMVMSKNMILFALSSSYSGYGCFVLNSGKIKEHAPYHPNSLTFVPYAPDVFVKLSLGWITLKVCTLSPQVSPPFGLVMIKDHWLGDGKRAFLSLLTPSALILVGYIRFVVKFRHRMSSMKKFFFLLHTTDLCLLILYDRPRRNSMAPSENF